MGFGDPFKRTSELCLDGRITRLSSHPAAAGGYADVWEGLLSDQKVAIKVMRPFASSGGKLHQNKLLRRLWREYIAWSNLSHPNVLKCLGFSYDFSPHSYLFPSLISPWMEHGTISTYLEKFPKVDRLKLVCGIAKGLSYLHERTPAIVHGDLRAGNILISELGIPYLSDFGLSRVLSEARGMTTSTDLAGSLRWMAPELFHVDCKGTAESDVWAFGMTVLEIMTGKRPYSTIKSDIFVLGQIRDGLIPSRPEDSDMSEGLSEQLWITCNRCWSPQPSQRPSMRDVMSMLVTPDQPPPKSISEDDIQLTKALAALDQAEGIYDSDWWDVLTFEGQWPALPSPLAFTSPTILHAPHPSVFPPPSPSLFSTRASTSTPSTSSQSPANDSQGTIAVVGSEFQKEGPDWFARIISDVPQRVLAIDVNLLHTFEHKSVVYCVRFSPDGKYLATSGNSSVQIYEIESGVKTCVLRHESVPARNFYIRSLCFSPDGAYLATGGDDNQIRIWDIAQRRIHMVFEGHKNKIFSLCFSYDGKLLVSGSADRTGRIWDMATGEHTELLIEEAPETGVCVISVAISPDSRHVATGSVDRVIRLWDVETGALIERLLGHKDGVYSIAFAPDGRGLVSGSLDHSLKHWDLGPLLRHPMRDAWLSQPYKPAQVEKQSEKGCECTVTFDGHKDRVFSMAVSMDGKWVVSGSRDGCVQFWDLPTAQSQLMLQGHKGPIVSIDLSLTGRMLATSGGDEMVRIWSLEELDNTLQECWKNREASMS